MRIKCFFSFLILLGMMILGTISVSAATYSGYIYTVSNGEVEIASCNSTVLSGEITIPKEIEGYPVTSIGEYAFSYCQNVTSVIIPDTVTSIGEYAFCGSEISSVTIGNGVESIGEYAFCGSEISSVTIGNGVESIGEYAFFMSNLTSVTIPNNVTYIGYNAFAGCDSLTSVAFDSVITGYYAFTGCQNLESILFGEGVTTISEGTFNGCDGLKNVRIGENVGKIGANAFSYCEGLTSVEIPESVTSIGNGAFHKSQNLTDVYYDGSSKNWKKIDFGVTNDELLTAKRHYKKVIYKFIDSDGAVIKEETVEYGTAVSAPEVPADKDPYTFDYWEGYSEEMLLESDIEFKAVYKYKTYSVNVQGVAEKVNVVYNTEFSIPVQEKDEYVFKGYYTKENCQGEHITDENGVSIKAYDVVGDLNVYPYFVSVYMNKIEVSGDDSAVLGETFLQKVTFATDKDVQYLIATVKYPETLVLDSINTKDFVETTKDSEITKNGYKYLSVTCIYDYKGTSIPQNVSVVPFELKFNVPVNAPLGEVIVSVDDAILIGDSDYEVVDIVSSTIEFLPKLAESIEIVGADAIDEETSYTAIVMPEHTSNKEVKWSVDDETVAVISEDGILTPLKNGTVIVTATAKDGSGVLCSQFVTVTAYAKLDVLDFGDAVSLVEYHPDVREYTIYVKENATSVTLKPSYTGGTLRTSENGASWLPNRVKTFELTDDKTIITLIRDNVENMTTGVYVINVEKFEGTKTKISEGGKEFIVNPVNVENGNTVILALYNNKYFVEMQSAIYKGETVRFTTDSDYTNVKVMVWNDLSELEPIIEAELVR